MPQVFTEAVAEYAKLAVGFVLAHQNGAAAVAVAKIDLALNQCLPLVVAAVVEAPAVAVWGMELVEGPLQMALK